MDDLAPYDSYMPSRQLTAVLILSVAVLGGFYLYEKSKPLVFEGTKEVKITIKDPDATLAGIRERDSDGDGIKDWEEALWGTDPYLRDTDNDGKGDGEEIAARKKGLGTEAASKEKLTQTDILARDIFITTVALKQSGNYSNETVRALSQGIAEKIRDNPIPDKYTDKNLILAKNSSPTSVALYGTAWLLLKRKYDPAYLGSEMYLISQILNNNKQRTAGTEIKRYATLYKTFAADLISILVPPALAVSQLEVANDTYAIGVALENTAKIFEDPVVGLIGLNQ